MTPTPARLARRSLVLLAAAGAALTACGGDLLEATSQRNLDTFEFAPRVVYPFSSAAAGLPTALAVSDPVITGVAAVRPAVVTRQVGNGVVLVPNFDFAFDVTADNRVRLVPSKLLAGLTTTGRQLRTGVRLVNTPLDSLASAPDGNYQNDSATVVAVGQTVVLDMESASCLTSGRPSIVAKFVVDSISSATGGVYVRGRVNPNCGFRSLRPGRPTS